MSWFDVLIVQPIFNLLMLIYSVIPGHDFGVTIIIFTIIIRVALWPLIKKQLHQTKIQQGLQQELKRIKKKAAGNRQLESQLMMELYKQKGVNPLGSIGILIIQIPIFIALYSVIRIVSQEPGKVASFTYDFLEKIPAIGWVAQDAAHNFNHTLFGIIDLSKHAFSDSGIYWPVLIIAIVAAICQYFQSRQTMPKAQKGRKLRDIMDEAVKNGGQPDSAEINALMMQKMIFFFPIMTFMFLIYVPGALGLYYLVTSGVAIFQQHRILSKDVEEMEILAGDPEAPVKGPSKQTTVRVINAKEAEVVAPKKSSPKKKKTKRR